MASDDSATDVAAGLLTLICLITGVIQLGVVIVLIPVVIYLFSTAETSTAIGFLIWAILVAPVDNILKPILLGRGLDVPTLVIFVGAMGGFLSSGIIGLFLGAVVLARLQALPYLVTTGRLDC